MQHADKTAAPTEQRPASATAVRRRPSSLHDLRPDAIIQRQQADLIGRGRGPAAGYTTRLPAVLQASVQALSGLRLDQVQVHHNALQPAAIGALAYAQGQHIYLGPGQEQHLPHEAWHVVQQAQGRVRPTQQLKSGAALNTDSALEQEADAMGARALQIDARALAMGTPERIEASPGPRVAQARLAPVTAPQAAAQPHMLREMLLLGLRHLNESEQTELTKAVSEADQQPWTIQDIVDVVRSGDAVQLTQWHAWLQRYTPENKQYVSALGRPEVLNASAQQTRAVIGHIERLVLPQLKSMLGHHKMHRAIFGPEADLKHIDTVLGRVFDALRGHVANATSPMVGQGNTEHALWVGVGGITRSGASQVELGLTNFDKATRGELDGLATLVHEFSHAAADTIDLAYDSAGMAKLTSPERVINAETYAQAFLEMHAPNPARHYDEMRVVVTAKATTKKSPKLIGQRIAGIKKRMTDLWQNMDNVYGMVPIALRGENTPLDIANAQSMVWVASYPHRPALRLQGDMAMALLEDRTRVLKGLMVKTSELNGELKAQGVNKERMESALPDPEAEFEALCALALMRPFNLSREQAAVLVHELLRLRDHLTLTMATHAPDSQPGMVLGMSALANLLDVESDPTSGASPDDARHQLGGMINRYGMLDYHRPAVNSVLAIYMRAIRARLPMYP